MRAVVPYLPETKIAFVLMANALMLLLHFGRDLFFRIGRYAKPIYRLVIVILAAGIIARVVFFARSASVDFLDLFVWTLTYAVTLFVSLCEVLLEGGAEKLTEWRGGNWVKEADYVYLMLGVAGLAWSVNKLDLISKKVLLGDFAGPFVVATALVVRAIKTRAEIGKWNVLPEGS